MARMKSKTDLVDVGAQKLIKEYWQTIQSELLIQDRPRNWPGRLRTELSGSKVDVKQPDIYGDGDI